MRQQASPSNHISLCLINARLRAGCVFLYFFCYFVLKLLIAAFMHIYACKTVTVSLHSYTKGHNLIAEITYFIQQSLIALERWIFDFPLSRLPFGH